MTREEKVEQVNELKEKFKNNPTFYVTDAGGLDVASTNALRRMCYEKGIEYKVYKNTLIKKALEEQEGDFSGLFDVLKGFSGIMFSGENANLPAKLIKEYRKKGREKPLLKGAAIESDLFLGDDKLDSLSELKSKNELIGEVITLLQSPAKNVIGALQSGGKKLSGIVKTLADREE